MKKTMLFIALVAVLVGTARTSNAQNGRFSIGAEVGMPMGDFGDAVSVGVGGSLRYEYPVSDNIGLMLTAGYLAFGGKDEGPAWGLIPVQAGAKYYFSENQGGLYAGVHVGIHSLSYDMPDFTYTDPLTGATITEEGESYSSSELSYAPEVGFHMDKLDLGLRYQIIATEGESISYLGLRLAFVLGEK